MEAVLEALAAFLGEEAPDLSAAVISPLTAEWQADYDVRAETRPFSATLRVRVGGSS
jgi:hypothetical protein